jgi:ubiquitin C-terminal hydrolase
MLIKTISPKNRKRQKYVPQIINNTMVNVPLSHSTIAPMGLKNQSNLCYFNSLIQILICLRLEIDSSATALLTFILKVTVNE